MRSWSTGGKFFLLGTALALSLPIASPSAFAAAVTTRQPAKSIASHAVAANVYRVSIQTNAPRSAAKPVAGQANKIILGRTAPIKGGAKQAKAGNGRVAHGPVLQCVAFARGTTGIAVSGNAKDWWDHAEGLYARGDTPEPGSVLAFTANQRMRLGHVAVVSRVVNAREIEVDQANWAGPGMRHGGVSHGTAVVDVSANNDWTAVRVGLGRSGEFGSVYPTYGFIYDRPETAAQIASAEPMSAPMRALNPPPRDLRPLNARTPLAHETYDEVAEAPLSSGPIGTDAPDRSLR
jgi:surface antigen